MWKRIPGFADLFVLCVLVDWWGLDWTIHVMNLRPLVLLKHNT